MGASFGASPVQLGKRATQLALPSSSTPPGRMRPRWLVRGAGTSVVWPLHQPCDMGLVSPATRDTAIVLALRHALSTKAIDPALHQGEGSFCSTCIVRAVWVEDEARRAAFKARHIVVTPQKRVKGKRLAKG